MGALLLAIVLEAAYVGAFVRVNVHDSRLTRRAFLAGWDACAAAFAEVYRPVSPASAGWYR